jgi:hypothetical protein
MGRHLAFRVCRVGRVMGGLAGRRGRVVVPLSRGMAG